MNKPDQATSLLHVTEQEALLLTRFRAMLPYDQGCMMRFSEAFYLMAVREERTDPGAPGASPGGV